MSKFDVYLIVLFSLFIVLLIENTIKLLREKGKVTVESIMGLAFTLFIFSVFWFITLPGLLVLIVLKLFKRIRD